MQVCKNQRAIIKTGLGLVGQFFPARADVMTLMAQAAEQGSRIRDIAEIIRLLGTDLLVIEREDIADRAFFQLEQGEMPEKMAAEIVAMPKMLGTALDPADAILDPARHFMHMADRMQSPGIARLHRHRAPAGLLGCGELAIFLQRKSLASEQEAVIGMISRQTSDSPVDGAQEARLVAHHEAEGMAELDRKGIGRIVGKGNLELVDGGPPGAMRGGGSGLDKSAVAPAGLQGQKIDGACRKILRGRPEFSAGEQRQHHRLGRVSPMRRRLSIKPLLQQNGRLPTMSEKSLGNGSFEILPVLGVLDLARHPHGALLLSQGARALCDALCLSSRTQASHKQSRLDQRFVRSREMTQKSFSKNETVAKQNEKERPMVTSVLALPPGRHVRHVLLVALAAAALLALASNHGGLPGAALVAIGLFAGLALYHASFGFTAAWRRFILNRQSAGLRAQLLMLAVTSLVFFPLLAAGSVFGRPVGGFVFPIGLALITGAFLFGIGMQLGGGCGSGTLFTIGGGSTRMVVTLAFFILGSTLATAYSGSWLSWPSLPPVSLITSFGALPGLALLLVALAAIYAAIRWSEVQRHGALAPINAPATRWLAGPWSLIAGALALALVNVFVLLTWGWPWGITGAFALWGSKIAAFVGFVPANWPYWQGQEGALSASVFADPVSVMDFALILGAMMAAVLAGKFRPVLAIPARSLLAAVIGGLLLGVGARLGTGCNIGAFFSGIVSGSLHGWVWLIFAFAGNILGTYLRPLFRLD